MRKLLQRLEAAFAAAAFAEEGEVETAREIAAEADCAERRPHAAAEPPAARPADRTARPLRVVRPRKVSRLP